ncbi:glycosyltransferase family 25 protein [Lentzea sp. NEAU-D13]|uniref:Glycosyltransferase family 25 protein n=1 Tax=Lentzea alba TaxID=2714351 RepID=A0A7C9VSK6_9PSEU|nr:glycosyltransferase family 25 protein [Lentzea alba]NGY61255.1 glycosyltransferase family 25 protein [Lentzea alba]
MINPSDLRCYVINLPRRQDRRAWIQRSLPPELPVIFTSDWGDLFDGQKLTQADLDASGYKLFPWQIESDNEWWSRPLKYGEIGCTLAHLACWRDAALHGTEPYTVVFEDDAVLPDNFLAKLLDSLENLARSKFDFDLLYLGRFPLEPDHDALPGFVVPSYSHCTFGYVVTRKALELLLAAELEHAIVPVDEFLPAMYIDHPRADLRARFPKQLGALAFEPPLVRQRPKDEAGSDTEDTTFIDP